MGNNSALQNFVNNHKGNIKPKSNIEIQKPTPSYSVGDEVLGSSNMSVLQNRNIPKTRVIEREPLPRYVYLLFINDKRLDGEGLDCDVRVYSKQETALKDMAKIIQDYFAYLRSIPEKYLEKMELDYEPNKKCIITENNGEFLIASVYIEKKPLI